MTNNNENDNSPQSTIQQSNAIPIEALLGQRAVMTKEQHDSYLSSMNIAKIIEDNKEKLVNAQMESLANERASLEPLPDIVNEVFDLDGNMLVKTSVGEIKIRKMVALDLTIFKLTDSPFYKLLMGDIEADKETGNLSLFPDEEMIYNLIYQFTNEVKAVYRLIKKDKVAYHEQVVEEVGTLYSPMDLPLITNSIVEYLKQVMEARVGFSEQEDSEDKDKKK